MSTSTLPSRHDLARDFAREVRGKLEQPKIDKAVAAIEAGATAYPATLTLNGLVFFNEFQVKVIGGETFNGKAGGMPLDLIEGIPGNVSTGNLPALYQDTVSFQVIMTPVAIGIIFFDASSNALGTFQCGSVATVDGVGGGSGGWSP